MALYKDKRTKRKRKQRRNIFVSVVALILVATMGVSVWAIVDKMNAQPTVAPSASESNSGSDSSNSSSTIPEPTSVRVMVAGDNLIHSRIYTQAAEKAGGNGYDFSYTYQHIAPLIAKADFGVINQETPLVASKPPSKRPLFV